MSRMRPESSDREGKRMFVFYSLLFGVYKFHLAKLNQDINHGQDNKIGLLASDSARIAFFQQKLVLKLQNIPPYCQKVIFGGTDMHTAWATRCCKTFRSKIKTMSAEYMNCQSQDLFANLFWPA